MGCPVETLWVEDMPFRLHLRVRRVEWNAAVSLRVVRWRNVAVRFVDVDPDEVEWRSNRLQLGLGELRGILASLLQVLVGVAPLEHHCGEVGIEFTSRSLGSLDVLGSVHDGNRDQHVFSKTQLDVRRTARANRLNRQSVTEHRVMTHLVELAVR